MKFKLVHIFHHLYNPVMHFLATADLSNYFTKKNLSDSKVFKS